MTDIYSLFREITSSQNSLLKDIRALQGSNTLAAKTRELKSVALLEGIHLLQSWANDSTAYSQIRAVLTTQSGLLNPEISDLLTKFAQNPVGCAHIDFILVEESIWQELTELKNAPHLIGLVQIPTSFELRNFQDDLIVLDGIQDAGNVGTILRTALAAGFHHVLALKGTAGLWSPKVLRAAMGAHPHLKFIEGLNPVDFVALSSTPAVSARLENATSLYELSSLLKNPVAWIFGNEGQGVTPLLAEHSIGAFIPIHSEIESLNVASAAAVCLFETVRVRASMT